MPASETTAALIAAAIAHGAAYQGPASIELALVTTLPTAVSAGTEVTGGSYARQTVNPASAFTQDGVGGFYNTTAVVYPTLSGTDYDAAVVAVEAYDHSDHTTRLWYIVLDSPVTKVIGETPQFPPGELYLTVV